MWGCGEEIGTTNMSTKYFFDIPVYRLTADRYRSDFEAYANKVMPQSDSRYNVTLCGNNKVNQIHDTGYRDHIIRAYGGCWRFNEIIGYIRLHFLGTQVRGEYFGVNRKRIVRTRTRQFEFHTWKLASEIDIPQPITSERVHNTVSQYLEACRAELPGRHIDTDLFDVIAKHVNWKKLFLTP